MRLKLTREQKVADRFLRGFDMVQDRLESSLIGLENAESARMSITASLDAMALSGSQHDKMADALERMEKAVDDLSEASERYTCQFADVEEFVSEVQRRDEQAGRVLRYVYINRMRVEQIIKRDETAYSKKTIYEHWKRGLDVAFDLLSGGNE